jgi:hypothetical protein
MLDKKVVGADPILEIVEMPDDATDEECDEACRECLESMIDNNLYTGWDELPPAAIREGRG